MVFDRKRNGDERSPFWNFERGSPRFPIELFVHTDGDATLVPRAGDIGLDGFCYAWDEPLEPGTRVLIRFYLPDTGIVDAEGEILGTTDAHNFPSVRGRFVGMTLEDRRSLARWLYHKSLTRRRRAA